MRKSRQGVFTALFLIMVVGGGCAELVKIGQGMQKAGDSGKQISEVAAPIANSFFPGAGLIMTGVSTLLSIAGAGLYKVASKRLTATQAIIQGVSYALENKSDIKDAISTIATSLKVEPYLNKLVQKYDPPKLTSTI
jgi:hypothetical protein